MKALVTTILTAAVAVVLTAAAAGVFVGVSWKVASWVAK